MQYSTAKTIKIVSLPFPNQMYKLKAPINWKYKLVKELLYCEDKIEHHCITHQSINDPESNKPSKFTNIDFNFYNNHNQQGAPSKGLNNQGNNLSTRR